MFKFYFTKFGNFLNFKSMSLFSLIYTRSQLFPLHFSTSNVSFYRFVS